MANFTMANCTMFSSTCSDYTVHYLYLLKKDVIIARVAFPCGLSFSSADGYPCLPFPAEYHLHIFYCYYYSCPYLQAIIHTSCRAQAMACILINYKCTIRADYSLS